MSITATLVILGICELVYVEEGRFPLPHPLSVWAAVWKRLWLVHLQVSGEACFTNFSLKCFRWCNTNSLDWRGTGEKSVSRRWVKGFPYRQFEEITLGIHTNTTNHITLATGCTLFGMAGLIRKGQPEKVRPTLAIFLYKIANEWFLVLSAALCMVMLLDY